MENIKKICPQGPKAGDSDGPDKGRWGSVYMRGWELRNAQQGEMGEVLWTGGRNWTEALCVRNVGEPESG